MFQRNINRNEAEKGVWEAFFPMIPFGPCLSARMVQWDQEL
jgi:hypothetical protein